MRRASIFSVLSLMLLVTPATPADDGKGNVELRKRLLKTWKRQREEIVTAKIVLKRYRWAEETCKPATVDHAKLTAAISGLRSSTAETTYQEVKKLFQGGEEHLFKIWMDGSNLRNERARDTVVVKDGMETRYVPGNRQVTLFPGTSGVEKLTLHKLRYIPYLRGEESLPGLTVASRQDGVASFRYMNRTFDILEETGEVTHATMDGSDGHLHTSCYQLFSMQLPGGEFFPKVFIMPKHGAAKKIRWIDIYLTQDAVLNQPVDSSLFAVAVPKGTVLVDNTKGGVAVDQLPTDVADIAQGLPVSIPSIPSDTRWIWLIAVAVIVLVLCTAWYSTRRRKA